MQLAPIVLFVYNRPWHTRKTLECLSENWLADKSILHIYADGPKENASKNDLFAIDEVRKIIKEKDWCSQVYIKESVINKGLAASVVDGVTEVVNEYGKVIVLEDDIQTSAGFLKYMNDALSLYEYDSKVGHISGYMFPVKRKLPETFFYNTASCWGWGTWKRSWSFYNNDAKYLLNEIREHHLVEQFNIEGTADFLDQLEKNEKGTIQTWAVKWYASLFLNSLYSLHPYPSLTQNIGNDGSGVNSSNTQCFNWKLLAVSIEVKKIDIKESEEARQAMAAYYQKFAALTIRDRVVKIVPESTKTLVKLCFDTSFRKKKLALKKIKKIKRYQHFETDILERVVLGIDSASFIFMYEEIFEKEIYKFKCFNKNPFIIDCGANIGLSILYFKKIYPDAIIDAYEADPKIYKILEKNVNSFDLKNVQIYNKAIYDFNGHVDFEPDGADGGLISLNNTILDSAKDLRVTTFRLKELLIDNQVDFLKLDIEGSETRVILDCADVLKNVKHLFVEYHSFIGQIQTLHQILDVLCKSGFRYYINTPGLTSANPFLHVKSYNNMDLQVNIYAINVYNS